MKMTTTRARTILEENGIKCEAFSLYHMRIKLNQFKGIGHVDFWPSSGKFIHGEHEGFGISDLIEYLKKSGNISPKSANDKGQINFMTADQLFEIAKKVKPMNLEAVCREIHKQIYGN